MADDGDDRMFYGFMFFAAVLIVLGWSGCAAAPKPLVTDHVVTVTVREPCAKDAPPTFTPVPRPTQCVAGKVCWSLQDGINFADDIERLKEWVAVTWAACQPQVSK